MGYLIVWIVISAACSIIAETKRRSTVGWFFLGLIGGPITVIVIACLPDLPPTIEESLGPRPSGILNPKGAAEYNRNLKRLKWESKPRECPHCAESIKRKANVCKHCGRDVEPEVYPDAAPADSGAPVAQ